MNVKTSSELCGKTLFVSKSMTIVSEVNGEFYDKATTCVHSIMNGIYKQGESVVNMDRTHIRTFDENGLQEKKYNNNVFYKVMNVVDGVYQVSYKDKVVTMDKLCNKNDEDGEREEDRSDNVITRFYFTVKEALSGHYDRNLPFKIFKIYSSYGSTRIFFETKKNYKFAVCSIDRFEELIY